LHSTINVDRLLPGDAMKKREVFSLALHIGVGAALAALVCWHPAFIIPVTFIYAWLREQAQHRYVIGEPIKGISNLLYTVEKQTFFGWITGHRIWEVFQWVIGAAVVVGIVEIWG
jgi:hypothetical protein